MPHFPLRAECQRSSVLCVVLVSTHENAFRITKVPQGEIAAPSKVPLLPNYTMLAAPEMFLL